MSESKGRNRGEEKGGGNFREGKPALSSGDRTAGRGLAARRQRSAAKRMRGKKQAEPKLRLSGLRRSLTCEGGRKQESARREDEFPPPDRFLSDRLLPGEGRSGEKEGFSAERGEKAWQGGNGQLVLATFLAVAGMALLFMGFWYAPEGEIHQSVLIGFGEVSTFAGALFGVDYNYKYKYGKKEG